MVHDTVQPCSIALCRLCAVTILHLELQSQCICLWFIEKCSIAVSQFWISMCYQNESQPPHVWFMIQYNHVALLCLGCAQLQLDTWKFSGNTFVYGFIEKCSLAVSKFWIIMLPKRISTAACMVHDTVQPCSIALSMLLRSYN